MYEPKAKIQRKEAVLGVIGLGCVGLPLAVEKAKAGFRVSEQEGAADRGT